MIDGLIPRIRGFIAVICFSAATVSVVYAQDLDFAALEAAAKAGNTEAQRSLGEALVYGIMGMEQDIPAGLRLLEQAVTSGDTRSKMVLGKVLLSGADPSADPARAARLLEEAAAAGLASAQTALGSALLFGMGVEADPLRGQTFLSQAADAGDSEGLRILGEQLVGGWILDRDVEAGLPMLEQAIASGDDQAIVTLGSLFLYGTGVARDRDRALALFEAAAEAGNGAGLEEYGADLMWSRRSSTAAERYLRIAAELGRSSAWTTLAEGALWGYLGRRSKFNEFADNANAANEPKVAVMEAQRRLWGISMRASGPAAIAVLEEAVAEGNVEALRFLISLTRDGNNLNVRKRPKQALAYLEQHADMLTPLEAAQFEATIEAVPLWKVSDLERFAAKVKEHPEWLTPWFGSELAAANENAAVYLLQADMKRDKVYRGALNGLSTKTTLRALLRECAKLFDRDRCRSGPMKPEIVGALLAR